MTHSWALRMSVRSPLSIKFLASCCVMVEPPTILGATALPFFFCAACASILASALAFLRQAFSTESHQMPLWLLKPLSSAAKTAR